MKNLYSTGLEITLILGALCLGLVIFGWFLYREVILGITMAYLLIHVILWITIMIFTLREKKK